MTSQPVLLHDLLAPHTSSDKVAIIAGDRRVTYREMGDLVARYAGALVAGGLLRRDRVAIFLSK